MVKVDHMTADVLHWMLERDLPRRRALREPPPVLTAADRGALLAALARLGDPSATVRADGAQEVASLRQRIGLDWAQMIPLDWREEAAGMIAAPCVDPNDRTTLRTMLRWKKPGRGGVALIQEIRAKLQALQAGVT